jgi:hypothetical protein
MKKWLLVLLLLLPLNLFGQGFEGKLLGIWYGGEYCSIDFDNHNTPGDWGYRTKPGIGLSTRFPIKALDLYVDVGEYFAGRNTAKYETTVNLFKYLYQKYYLFGGGNLTSWSLTQDQKSKSGVGFQVGVGTTFAQKENDYVFIELGFKYNSGKMKDIDNDFYANAPFLRLGVFSNLF